MGKMKYEMIDMNFNCETMISFVKIYKHEFESLEISRLKK